MASGVAARHPPAIRPPSARHPPAAAAACDGLANGWARSLRSHQPVRAAEMNRERGPRLQIGQDFTPRWRGSFVPENERNAVPACHLWFDRLAPWW